ncbi:serine/threonine-protein kinase [Actinoallomurus sp. NPDC052308]|uniref:serine/threonine-protein kinase n=1 Tax=Actinoallomurus sp. NPDC052308 TaxID=3155530 RepID=UPI0034120732
MAWRKNRADRGLGEDVAGYRDLAPVGHGGFGVVYRAWQVTMGRHVALKVLSVPAVDDRIQRRVLRECRLTGLLAGHPNVVTVYDAGTTRSGRPYIAMEYFERGSLKQRLDAAGPLPVEEVLRIGVKIAGALAAAHESGVLHRDVKPQNILISRYGEPALADFGVARLRSRLDSSSVTDALTPHHTAPEVLHGGQSTESSDVYSLGSTLYEVLAGRPAYRRSGDEGIAPVLLRMLSEDPPAIPRPDVPTAVLDAIRQAMARQPPDRFPTSSAFAAELRRIQADLALPVTDLPNRSFAPVTDPPRGPLGPVPDPPHRTLDEDASATTGPPTHPRPDPPGDRGGPDTGPPGEVTPQDPDLSETMLRPGRGASRDAPAGPRRRRRGRWLVAGAAALALGCAGTVLYVGGHTGEARPSTPGPSPRSLRTAPSASAPAAVVQAARPTRLTAVANDTSVTLHWRLGSADGFPLFLQQVPAGSTGPRPLRAGTTTTTVVQLDPKTGYCFRVGAVVVFGQPSVVAWSKPACIRGAIPVPEPTR